MTVEFQRPIGAQADAKEIEYISALHQSGERIRSNGSIRDEDIKVYLRSRFGIEVSLEEVRSTILHGLGGSSDEEEVIDLMELTAIILIPLLVKAAAVENGQELPPGVLPPPKNLLENVAQIMLHDVTGGHNLRRMTPTLIKQIFKVYGEKDMADDEELIAEMVNAAGGEGIDFDSSSLAMALAGDVQLYDISNETRWSTSIQDVFNERQSDSEEDNRSERTPTSMKKDNLVDVENTETEASSEEAYVQIEDITRIYTAPAIDIQAGTYRSKALAVSAWGCIVFGLFVYTSEAKDETTSDYCRNEGNVYVAYGSWSENRDAVGCELGISIANWLLNFSAFCMVGMLFMGLGSLGNFAGNTRRSLPLIGGSVVSFFAFGDVFANGLREVSAGMRYIKLVSCVLGGIVGFLHLAHFASLHFDNADFVRSKWGRRLGFSGLGAEANVKQAAAFKLNQLASNASQLLKRRVKTSVFKTYFGHGLSAFALHGQSYEPSGSVMWVWRKIRDESIFNQEGLWYSTRLVASNFSQIVISVFILLSGIGLLQRVVENYDEEEAQETVRAFADYVFDTHVTEEQVYSTTFQYSSLVGDFMDNMNHSGTVGIECSGIAGLGSQFLDSFCGVDDLGFYDCSIASPEDSLCTLLGASDLKNNPQAQLALLEAAGFNVSMAIDAARGALQASLYSATDSLYPEELYMLTVPLVIGTIVATLAAIRLASVYIPSVTTTILRLRAGAIPSLHSEEFEKYRVAPDSVTLLTGSMFWGCLVSSILFGFVVALIIFLFLWQGSRYWVFRLLVFVIGLLVVILFRVGMVTVCRASFYKGLYRTKPAAANISMLALEWANYIFTSAFILIRMVKLVLIAVTSVGQIDRPFLAAGVGEIGPLELDPYPTIHLRDLVAHEAHRHPYIEILGTMYLMKLRYAKHFGNRAGSGWRLLFVYALLPWMHQYRIFGDDDERRLRVDDERLSRRDRLMQSLELVGDFSGYKSQRVSPHPASKIHELESQNELLRATIRELTLQLAGTTAEEAAAAEEESIEAHTRDTATDDTSSSWRTR